MYLHIGEERVIALADLIAVVNARSMLPGSDSRAFVEHARRTGRLVTTGVDEPKAYIVTTDAVYASSISATTLKRRAMNPRSWFEGE